MLITFRCKDYPDITMFGEVGQRLLSLMGHSKNVPGIISAKEVPIALERLKNGIKSSEVSSEPIPQATNDDPENVPVSLGHRALPLIELLTAAEKGESDVNIL